MAEHNNKRVAKSKKGGKPGQKKGADAKAAKNETPAKAKKSLLQGIRENKTAAVLATISVLLFALFVAMKISQAPQNGVPAVQENEFYLAFANDSHSRIQAMAQSAQQVQLPSSDDKISQASIQAFQESFIEDIGWIEEKERANYGKMVSAKTVEELKSLSEKEAAITITSAYVLELNIIALDGMSAIGLSDPETMSSTVEDANRAAKTITLADFSGEEIRQDAAANLGISAENIHAETDALMQEFIETRKQKFLQAGTEIEQGVEAQKLAELDFLMAISEQA